VLVRNGKRILIGKMAKPEIWVERFFVGESFAPGYLASDKFLIPARHIAWYESPLDAAKEIVIEQVGVPLPRRGPKLLDVQSHVRGDVRSQKEPPHWDICFVYDVEVSAKTVSGLKPPAWFRDLRFTPLSSLTADDFTRGHGDILQEAGLIH
jgi:hypothetical protein